MTSAEHVGECDTAANAGLNHLSRQTDEDRRIMHGRSSGWLGDINQLAPAKGTALSHGAAAYLELPGLPPPPTRTAAPAHTDNTNANTVRREHGLQVWREHRDVFLLTGQERIAAGATGQLLREAVQLFGNVQVRSWPALPLPVRCTRAKATT